MSITIVVDLDGTVSAYPKQMCDLMCAFKAAGYTVVVLTGCDEGETYDDKQKKLMSLGVTKCWDTLVAVKGNIPKLKAQWCKTHGVSVMIDNNINNCKAAIAAGVPLALVPWATRSKKDESGK